MNRPEKLSLLLDILRDNPLKKPSLARGELEYLSLLVDLEESDIRFLFRAKNKKRDTPRGEFDLFLIINSLAKEIAKLKYVESVCYNHEATLPSEEDIAEELSLLGTHIDF